MELKNLCQYNVENAFFKVDFGSCPYGVFSAAMPIEPLHSLENGLMKDCLEILFEQEMTLKERSEIDYLAKAMRQWDCQHYLSSGANKAMPTLLWKNGISTMTNTSSYDKVGLMLTIIVLSLTFEGAEHLETCFQNELTLKNMREAFQMMMAYWIWLKQKQY